MTAAASSFGGSKVFFVSGHMDLTEAEFKQHYAAALDRASADPTAAFVIGNARGADTMALDYLLCDKAVSPDRITVYIHSGHKAKAESDRKSISAKGVKVVPGPFESAEARDAQMTRDSTEDIAWERPAEEQRKKLGKKYNPNHVSGTKANILRRTAQPSSVLHSLRA